MSTPSMYCDEDSTRGGNSSLNGKRRYQANDGRRGVVGSPTNSKPSQGSPIGSPNRRSPKNRNGQTLGDLSVADFTSKLD
mmetsp:Transcript_27160/g.42472  ORF Transcript_27160/g.42472 Transcript_27160/m.42472 type:complete len:80 (-) Transcript_27160:78-317(-)